LNIPGLKKTGSYSLTITVSSKSTSSNSLNKSISVVNNPLGRFMGYKVASNARQLGFEYWYHGTGVMPDLITAIFQKPYNGRSKYGTFFNGVVCGDFNNDGWVDVFNAGASYNGVQAPFTFLIWNTTLKTFEEKNLFNDKSFSSFGGNKNTIKPYYFNDDNFIDLIIFDNGDEGIANSPDEPVRIVLSDGKGGYDLKSINTSENEFPSNKKEKGVVGEIYNIGCDEGMEYSILELAKILIKKIKNTDNYEEWIKFIEDRPFNDKRYYISNKKLKELGWTIKIKFEDGINNLIINTN
jgi:hypothetical protein